MEYPGTKNFFLLGGGRSPIEKSPVNKSVYSCNNGRSPDKAVAESSKSGRYPSSFGGGKVTAGCNAIENERTCESAKDGLYHTSCLTGAFGLIASTEANVVEDDTNRVKESRVVHSDKGVDHACACKPKGDESSSEE